MRLQLLFGLPLILTTTACDGEAETGSSESGAEESGSSGESGDDTTEGSSTEEGMETSEGTSTETSEGTATDTGDPGACPATIDIFEGPGDPLPPPTPFLDCALDSPCNERPDNLDFDPDTMVCIAEALSAQLPGEYLLVSDGSDATFEYRFRLYDDGLAEYWDYATGEVNRLLHMPLDIKPGYDFTSCPGNGFIDCIRAGFSPCSEWGSEDAVCP